MSKSAIFSQKTLCLFVAAALCPLAGHAQTETKSIALEEVIVSAQKQDESIQKTPISLAAFDSASLEKMGFTNLSNIQASVPNLSMRQMPSSKAAMRLFIRGIGNNDAQATQDPAIAVYADGIYIARSTGLTTEIADVERIEVLRGPQGSLYGRNATGGAINIISKRPTGEFGLRQDLSIGDYGLWRWQTTVNLPEVANISTKVAYIKARRDGVVKNEGPGWSFGEEDKQAFRIAFAWDATDNFEAHYAFDWSEIESGMSYQQTIRAPKPGFEAVPYDKDRQSRAATGSYFEPSDVRIHGHSLTLDWALSDNVTLKSLTGYRKIEEALYEDYAPNTVTPRLFANDPFDSSSRTFSQEFQVVGSFDAPAIDYVAGLYYFDEKGTEVATDYIGLNFGGGIAPYLLQSRDTEANNSAVAAYGQFTWTPAILDDSLHITVGARYSSDKREVETSRLAALDGITFDNVKADKTFNHFSPSLIIAYDITQDMNTYLKYTDGYRTGGFNGRANRASGIRTPVDEETVKSYEAGFKSQWLDNRVRFNTAVFWMNYEDLQLSFAAVGDASDVRFFNVGKADIKGAEVDLTAVLTEGLVATVSYGYLDSALKDIINPITGAKPIKPFHLPSAPRNSYTVDLAYTFPSFSFGTLAADLNYSWRDAMATSTDLVATPYAKLGGYGLLNARITLSEIALTQAGQFKVAVWGKNLTDKEYLVDAVGAFSWSEQVGIFGDPRTFGVDFTYEY